MPYPYPKTGAQYFPQYYTGTVATKAGCSPPTESTLISTSSFGGGFGYRSQVIKSDGIYPTPYQVYWSEVDKGKCLTVYGGTTSCAEYSPVWPYGIIKQEYFRDYAHSGIPRMWGSLAVCHMNNMYNPGPSGGVGLRTLPSALGPITRIRTHHQQLIDGLDNMILESVANTTNNIGVSIAESFKTSRYLISKVTEVAKFCTLLYGTPKRFYRFLKKHYKRWSGVLPPDARRSYRAKTREILHRRPWDERIGARWLEVNYAALPIIYDVNGFLEFYDPSTAKPIRFSVKRRANTTGWQSWTGSSGISAYSDIKYKILVGRSFQIDDPFDHALKRLGISPSQLTLGVIWELIPFSFVLDWVIDLTGFFERMSAMQGVTYLHGYASISMEATEHIVEDTDQTGSKIVAEQFRNLDMVPQAPSTPKGAVNASPPHQSGLCIPFRYRTKAFRRFLLTKAPSNSLVFPGLGAIGSLNYVTLLSLVGVLRNKAKIPAIVT